MNSSYFRTMISLSKSEFNVIGFLIRNFSKRFTIRSIASRLEISAAGAHSVLKKLEKNNVVKADRLGTGLFYYIDLDSKIANHLASIVLIEQFDVKKIDTEEIEKESKAVIFDGKRALVVTTNEDIVKDVCYRNFKEIKVICKEEEEFVEALRGKEKDVLEILENGNVLFGEELILNSIKRVMR